jgi:signal peptidase I
MIPWILLILLIVVYSITLPKLLTRAGLSPTLGYIPIVNFLPFLKMIKRPWWWFLLLLCPGVNLLMLVVINVELGIVFGKRSTKDQWMFGALPWYAISNLAFTDKGALYIGARDWTGKKKSFMREWGEAIVFAVVAASVIRTFFIEAFTIPTPSMEKSMLVGDYLFVSKTSYGAKIPQTPVSVPFVHNALAGRHEKQLCGLVHSPLFPPSRFR